MAESGIRWKQRFQNFEKAFDVFSRIVAIENPSEAERMGLIQSFEVMFELSWKVLQDFSKEKGYLVKGPRDVLKQSFQNGWIADGETWLLAMEDRNKTVHTYDEHEAQLIADHICHDYFPVIQSLYEMLSKELVKD